MYSELPRLLLVEEDPTLAEVTLFRLELMGYIVDHASCGAEALNLVNEKPPQAIILDIALPDIDGYELANRLSNDPATSNIPMMAFSSDSNLDNVQRAHAAGIKEYLVVPYDPAVLEYKLENLLTQKNSTTHQ